MGRKVLRLILGAVLAITVSTASGGPDFAPQTLTERTARSPDERFMEATRTVPGFGGVFYDDDGELTVYMLDTTPEAEAALNTILSAERLVQGTDTEGDQPQALLAGEMTVLQGQYSFSQLMRWHENLIPALEIPGVIFTDIDEATNRLKIGVAEEASLSSVESELAALGLPSEAVIIEQAEPIYPLTTLRERVRGVVGGLQINYPGFLCTLGFIAERTNPDRTSVPGFVTNSHCTITQGGVESTPYYQPLSADSDSAIGTETVDPNYFTGGSCPTGRRCRFSDSAFAELNSSTSRRLGQIARTRFRTRIIEGAPFKIVQERAAPLVGEEVDKVGRSTGWTFGKVTRTCVNTNLANTDITLLCQSWVGSTDGRRIVAGGDSGSPVFSWRLNGEVVLGGILWGGNDPGTTFVFSAMGNVEQELEALKTF